MNVLDTPTPAVIGRTTQRDTTVGIIGTMYLAYATSMVLRMIPTVAGTSIRADESLGINLEQWGKVLAAGTCGAMLGKFICGWAADRFGGKRTFAVALFVASAFVGLFAMSSTLLMFQVMFFVTLMAQAAGWPSMTKIIVNWVPVNQYGRVWGILSTSSRVGALTATFLLGSLLTWTSWRGMLWLATAAGFVVAVIYVLRMRERPSPVNARQAVEASSEPADAAAHPFDGLSLPRVIARMLMSLRFWLICASLMGLTILWDFLLLAPMCLQDTLGLSVPQASRAASAFPLGSLISVLAGGFLFDRLGRARMAWCMAGLMTVATACLLTFAWLPGWDLSENSRLVASIILLFVFGLCVSPCYYIPVSVFSIAFGGPRSGFLVAILDAVGFAATAGFYYFGGGIAQNHGWPLFLQVLAGVSFLSLLATVAFMRLDARAHARIEPIAA